MEITRGKCLEESGQDERQGEGAHKAWPWGVKVTAHSPCQYQHHCSGHTRVCHTVYNTSPGHPPVAPEDPEKLVGSTEPQPHQGRFGPRSLCSYHVTQLSLTLARVWKPVKPLRTSGQREIWGTEKWVRGQAEESDASRKCSIHHRGHPKWSLPPGSARGRAGEGGLRLNNISDIQEPNAKSEFCLVWILSQAKQFGEGQRGEFEFECIRYY